MNTACRAPRLSASIPIAPDPPKTSSTTAPFTVVPSGNSGSVNWIGPTLMRYGSQEQQARYIPPMARGETVVTEETNISAAAEPASIVAMPATADVGSLAQALNALGVAPRDLIAILQALKQAGALQAELVIM